MYIFQNIDVLKKAPRAIFHGDIWGSELRNSDTAYLISLIKSKGILSRPSLTEDEYDASIISTIDSLLPDSLKTIGTSLVLLDVLFSEYRIDDSTPFKTVIHLNMNDDLKRRAWGAIRDKIDDIS